jgi:FAD/FMN-containing dehydrogenase
MINRRSFLAGAGGAALAATVLPGSARAQTRSGIDWSRLSGHLQGRLVLPSDADYPTAKQLYLIQFDDTSPRAVAYCASDADVALCLRFAQDHAVPIAVRSGGHSAGGYSTTPGLVIDVSRLNSVTVGSGTTTIGTGAQLVDITNTLAPAGLAISTGYCPTVAAGGFLQGGGLGVLTRSIGVAADKVQSARVVLADGRSVTASPHEHSDLYWAIRGGGGGNFGVVTSYTLTPTPITQMSLAVLYWPFDQALDTLDGWTQWLRDAPSTVGGGGVTVLLQDAAPGNVPLVYFVMGSVDTSPAFGTEIDRLVSLIGHPPTSRQIITAPYQSVMMTLYQCTDVEGCHRVSVPGGRLPRPALGLERGRMFDREMPREGWAKALALFDTERLPGQLHELQVSALGGQANTLPRRATAYVHRDARYMANFLVSNAVPPVPDEAKATAGRFVDAGFAVLDPYSNGETYQNFIDPRLPDWKRSYYAENYPRLKRVKGRYDPHNVFHSAQSIR